MSSPLVGVCCFTICEQGCASTLGHAQVFTKLEPHVWALVFYNGADHAFLVA
jgi:hypothetical protein